MSKPKLSNTTVDGRVGYVDEGGQVFAVPKGKRRRSAWLTKMSERYSFPATWEAPEAS